MDNEAKEVAAGVTAFELLFYMAACLVGDNLPIDKLNILGYKKYPGNNNPYDTGFGYECDNGNGVELIDFCRDWCNKNYQEWEKIFALCKKYKNDLNTDKIEEFYGNVFLDI